MEQDNQQTEPIQPSNDADFVVKEILRLITNQTYRSGARITEADICSRLGVSRTPVREAFRILQSRNLLIYHKARGMEVTVFDHEKLRELNQIRHALAVLSAREAAPVISDADLAHLAELNEALLRFDFEHCQPEESHDIDNEFHLTIARAANNPLLYDFLTTTLSHLAIFWYMIPLRRERVPFSCREHEDILRALRQHDPELAAKYTDIHFTIASKSLSDKMEALERAMSAQSIQSES